MPKKLSCKPNDLSILKILKKVIPFRELSDQDLKSLQSLLNKWKYKRGDIVIQEGESGSTAFIVVDGEFSLNVMDRELKTFSSGDLFGEIALIDTRPRTGTIKTVKDSILLSLEREDLEDDDRIAPGIAKKIYKGFARLISSYMREGSTLYDSMDILLVQDGGCAPGYNPITASITEYLSKQDRNVFIAAEGFRSLISNRTSDYYHLVYHPHIYKEIEHIPGVIFSPPLREARGADFRSERYPDFKYAKQQKIAVKNIIQRKVNVLIGIGGNGTFAGINELSKMLPYNIQSFFIPVTIDSDIYGTDCIGEFTGVEVGAEKIRSYMADARTHKRIYIIEMMGARGGYHALYSCLGAGAHLAVLPSSNYNLKEIAEALKQRDNVVIVVAEGYKEKIRMRNKYKGNAAEYFRDELYQAGLKTDHRIICEGFSRDIRGAAPNNLDITLAQRMARNLSQFVDDGQNRLMPAVLSGKEYSIHFDKIRTDNTVELELASLANRLT